MSQDPPPDPQSRPAPVQVQIGGTAGLLLVRLMQELGTSGGGGGLSRALGLLDLALRARRQGQSLCLVDPKTGHSSEVAF